jgi:heme exporter protein A
MDALLTLDQLSCVRGERRLFSAVSRQLGAGGLLHVMGANGAGKTSLLRMLCGLLSPASGQVRWRGQPLPRARDALARDLIYLGHTAALKDDLSALENLQAAQSLAGRSTATPELSKALADAGLRGRETLPTKRLSQGQRQRVALARLSLSSSAPLWVLDEPFNTLDAPACDWLGTQLSSHLRHGGLVVLTSHQPLALPGVAHETLTL